MIELIDGLNTSETAKYLLDTCFLLDMVKRGKTKELKWFCAVNKTGMASFNLAELVYVHHNLDGEANHHLRDFLKEKLLFRVPVPVSPGDKAAEEKFVRGVSEDILRYVPDPSDAVLIALAKKLNATVLTKDKHHVFTAAAANHNITVLKELP